MSKKYDLAVVIGEFSPVTQSSIQVIEEMSAIAQEVLVIIENAFRPRSIDTPWNQLEREDMISLCLNDEISSRVSFSYFNSRDYSKNANIYNIQSIVDFNLCYASVEKNIVFTNLGYNEDFAADNFPQWEYIYNTPSYFDEGVIRDTFLEDGANAVGITSSRVIHQEVIKWLQDFETTEEGTELFQEYNAIQQYKQSWDKAPFTPIFSTVDALVIKSGHVLMVRRKKAPGKGLWALPGGFLEAHENISDAVLRELNEEACLEVDKKDIVTSKVFAYPYRSTRGRTITTAFLIDLGNGPLPEVYPADDAIEAKWFTFYESHSMRNQTFEDHSEIISWGLFCV